MSASKPLVSVFIPYYNDAKFLRIAIDAVLASTYQNFELVLLNHASTDESKKIAHSYTDRRIKHIDMQYNLGAGSGVLLKEFLNVARGKYIKCLCADDIICPNGLADLVEFMETHPDADFAFGDVQYVDEDGCSMNETWFHQRPGFSTRNTPGDCIQLYAGGISFLPWIGAIVRRDILDTITINTTFVMMFDMSLWLSLLCRGYKIGYCESVVCNYRIHSQQVSATANEQRAGVYSYYEWMAFSKIFLEINSLDLLRQTFPDEDFAHKISDKRDIPFVVAHTLWSKYGRSEMYTAITQMLNDDTTRQHIEDLYDYTIKSLRTELLTYNNLGENQAYQNPPTETFKSRIYHKASCDLTIPEIAFLMIRWLYRVPTWPLRMVKRRRRNQDYSL